MPEGPRSVSWRSTAPHTLYWIEALDGGCPTAEAPYRDQLMRLTASFDGESEQVFLAENRVRGRIWTAEGDTLMLVQRERMRRWAYWWIIDVAEAAVAKAIEIGVAHPERIGIIGHSHGGLMVANLLAHTDLFSAGIVRSGSYNKTNRPFGFQSERRSLFEARDAYIQLSPTFFADQVNEPVLVIHGDDDSDPGTLAYQSEAFFEAVRGSGGTARLVLLPHEDHGYRSRESIEHVLWEQLQWFDRYVKGSGAESGS